MKVRTGWLIVCYSGAFHSFSRQTCYCTGLSWGTADSRWQPSGSSKPLLSCSLVTVYLCWFWTSQTFEKGKSIILSPLSDSFIHHLSALISCTRYLTHSILCKSKMSRRDHLAEPCLVRVKSPPVCINEAQCPAHVSPPLCRHAWRASSRAAPPFLLSHGNLHQINQGVRKTANQDWTASILFRVDSAVRKDLVRDLSTGQQGSLDSIERAGGQEQVIFLVMFWIPEQLWPIIIQGLQV